MLPSMCGNWPGVVMNTWMAAFEASIVIPLRLNRIAMGGKGGAFEANRMVTEKLAANAALTKSLVAGKFGDDADDVAYGVSEHYLRYVRANRQRLVRDALR